MTLPIIQFDRSRTERYQFCPRARWYGYEMDGIGLEREALAVPLLTGGQVHKGLEHLLVNARQHPQNGLAYKVDATEVDSAVYVALKEYDSQVADRGIDEAGVVGESNRAMIEALIRGYALVSLPSLLERFGVLGVECEEEAWWEVDRLTHSTVGPMATNTMPDEELQKVRLLARLDALLKRKADGATFVLSFKTCSAADQWWVEGFLYDNQSQSECIAAEARLGHPVDGVIVQGLIKGPRKVKYLDQWHNSSPLIWGWWNEDKNEWAIEYEWVDEAGLTRRLGKGFRRTPVWSHYPGGVAGWLEKVASERLSVLQGCFIELSPILRSDWERQQWVRQTLSQEVRVAESAQLVNSEQDSVAKQHLLDIHFAKHSAGGNCIRPSKCQFHSLCWSAAGQAPLESGYRYRTFNHKTEAEYARKG